MYNVIDDCLSSHCPSTGTIRTLHVREHQVFNLSLPVFSGDHEVLNALRPQGRQLVRSLLHATFYIWIKNHELAKHSG